MNPFNEELSQRLETLRKQGLRRELRRVDSAQVPRIKIGGKTFLNFSSNDYLGLANHPVLKEAAIKAVKKFGAGEPIGLGALVELENGGENLFYFIGPRAGGTEILHDKKEILVITPQSPLGEQLLGKKSGDQPQLNFGGAKQVAKILKVE